METVFYETKYGTRYRYTEEKLACFNIYGIFKFDKNEQAYCFVGYWVSKNFEEALERLTSEAELQELLDYRNILINQELND